MHFGVLLGMQYRQQTMILFPTNALNDADPVVWQKAMDGC